MIDMLVDKFGILITAFIMFSFGIGLWSIMLTALEVSKRLGKNRVSSLENMLIRIAVLLMSLIALLPIAGLLRFDGHGEFRHLIGVFGVGFILFLWIGYKQRMYSR